MAMHAPAIHPQQRVFTFPNLWPAAVAVVLVGLLTAAVLMLNPTRTANPAAPGIWMTRDRAEEIGNTMTGPAYNFLEYRHGEFGGQ